MFVFMGPLTLYERADHCGSCFSVVVGGNFLPSSAQPSQAATGGSQISWAEISFIITAQPPTHPSTHPGIVVEKDKKEKEKEKKISVNKIKKIFTLLKQNKTEKKNG